MRPLNGELLLEIWDRGANQSDLVRVLLMLEASGPGRSWEDLANLSIADRNLELLRLRSATFGDALRGSSPCPSCATRLEFEIPIRAMIERLESLHPQSDSTWRTEQFVFSMRPVTTRDLAAIGSAPDARSRLLSLCTTVNPPDVESALIDCDSVAAEHFNRLNEGAEIRFDLSCPACGASDRVDLDIARFLWSEIRNAARTALREVHELASAYGWPQSSILRMSSSRREMYLEMVRQ